MFEWFADSLRRELNGDYSNVNLIVVDYHANEPGRRDSFAAKAHYPVTHVAPMPSPWQGPKRYTYQDYFDATTARNTAICYAPDGWIVFVDDLSVLLPGWIRGVLDAIKGEYVACGAYKKVKKLHVENGEVISFEPFPGGVDGRWNGGSDAGPVPLGGGSAFGCSFALPVNAFLATNGQDQRCSGLGFEDVIFGIALENHGWKFKYDRRMATYESEERHFLDAPFPKFNRKNVQGHQDCAWALLKHVQGGQKWFVNYYGPEGLRGLRARILSGGTFDEHPQPMHLWADGTPLSEIRGTE